MNSNSSVPVKVTMGTLLVTLGIIYGDIGTSPLYVLKAIVGERPISEQLVYGGVSCVFWTLVFQTTFKYIFLTLKADNHGEGGIFALYALIRQFRKRSLVIPTILGATCLLADGIITPPISITSAVEGLEKVAPHLPTVPIVIVILCFLFFFQRFGTQKVGSAFGPVMVLWFLMLFVLGVNQIMQHPGIFKALSPHYAYDLLVRYPKGFWLLGAVFLCTTGAEALYSDLGHCGRKNIRITWVFVKSCLVVNYLGQASWAMTQKVPYLSNRNPFFEIMPDWFLVPGIVIATAAAIIASQALISGSYTLISEAMSLNFWPRVAVRHPTELKGQIYIPSVNNILWVGCGLTVLYFKNSTAMEAAYGFFITLAMLMTSILLLMFLRYIKKWHVLTVGFALLLFGCIELSFFVANIAKLQGRWMFLLFALVVFVVMYVWFFARKLNNRFVHFVDINKYLQLMEDLSEDDSIPKFSNHLIYLTKADRLNEIEEKIIKSIFGKKPKRADVYWFLHINRTDDPYAQNYHIDEIVNNKIIKITINLGFRIQPRVELYFKRIIRELIKTKEFQLIIRPDGANRYNPEPDFKFVVIEKFLSVENEFSLREGILLNAYFFLKRFGQSDEKAFGLDKNDVVVEHIPLVYQPAQNIDLKRV